jgi:hypothetical protein
VKTLYGTKLDEKILLPLKEKYLLLFKEPNWDKDLGKLKYAQ